MGSTCSLINTVLYYINNTMSSVAHVTFFPDCLYFFLCVGRNPAFSVPGNIWYTRGILYKGTLLLVVKLGHKPAMGDSQFWCLNPCSTVQQPGAFTSSNRSHSSICCISSGEWHTVFWRDSAKLVKYSLTEWLLTLNALLHCLGAVAPQAGVNQTEALPPLSCLLFEKVGKTPLWMWGS